MQVASASHSPSTLNINKEEPVRGIIPQTDTIPTRGGDFFRTGWKGDAAIGRGFFRESSLYGPQAISFEEVEIIEDAPPVSMDQSFSVITTAQEYAEAITVGTSLSVEAWVVSLSVSMEVTKNTEFASNGVTMSLIRSYKSDPVLVLDPLIAPIPLSKAARNLLRDEGPRAFHEKFGSHYVAGYTFGGMFSGYYQSRYSSTSEAESAKTSISASAGAFGVKVSASAEISEEIQTTTKSSSSRAAYTTTGWNSVSNVPPRTVIDVKTMLDAANEMEIDNGERLEAILALYEDLPDYQEELNRYRRNTIRVGGVPEEYNILPKDHFNVVSQLLNSEFMKLSFLDRVLSDLLLTLVDPSPDLLRDAQKLRRTIFGVQSTIRSKFGTTNTSRENWDALATYIDSMKPSHEPSEAGSDKAARVEVGRHLADSVFLHKKLQDSFISIEEQAQEFIPQSD